jgi:hypothetical protein
MVLSCLIGTLLICGLFYAAHLADLNAEGGKG